MNPLAIVLGGAAGWFAAGFFDKKPLFRGVVAFSGAYVANAIAGAQPAQAATPPRVNPAPRVRSSAPAGSSDTLSTANIAAFVNDAGGGGGSF